MKLVQIAGYLGSGKTTLIIALSKGLSEQGKRVAILVNDVGEVSVDGSVMEKYGLTVKDIGGGCICCQVAGSMLKTLELLSKGPRPDIIIIEPTGMAVPKAIKETVLMLSVKKVTIDIGPTIVLFDMTRSEKLLSYDTLKRLITTQLKDADIVALSKIDMVSEEAIGHAGETVHLINPEADIIRLSTRTGVGLTGLVRAASETTVRA
jgi:G3E family GTPase